MPLHPRRTLPAVPALSLALHLGLSLDVASLARLFQLSPDDIGLALQRARQEIDPQHVCPCPSFASQIGRHRDPHLDRSERLEFLQHLETCGRCQLALEHARQSDDALLAAVNREQSSLADQVRLRAPRRAVWLGPLLFSGGVALLALIVVALALAGSYRLLHRSDSPVPLLATNRPAPRFSGWLLETSQPGDVDAVNLTTGERRLLVPGEPNYSTSVSLSPDHTLIALAISEPNNGGRSSLRIYRIDGTFLHEWQFASVAVSNSPLGWLDDQHFMMEQVPQPRGSESSTDFQTRLAKEEQVLSIDVRTGAQRAVLTGAINMVSASPDGKYVAVEGPTTDGLEIRPVVDGQFGAPVSTFHGSIILSVVWTPDSRRVVFFSPTTDSTDTAGSIDVVDLKGNVTSLTDLPAQDQFVPNATTSQPGTERVLYSVLSVSPDGRQVVYGEIAPEPVEFPLVFWEMPLAGGTRHKLVDSGVFAVGLPIDWQPVWSPDGTTVAATALQPFYLPHPQQGSTLTSVNSYVRLAFDGQGQALGGLADEFAGLTPLAWLPADALPSRVATGTHTSNPFQIQSAVKTAQNTSQIMSYSRVSPHGSAVLVFDQTYDYSMETPVVAGPATIAGAPIDASWLPDGSGAIGVIHHMVDGDSTSRIELFGRANVGGGLVPVDFDPAQLGNGTTATYRMPMLSPDGLHYSFFVVDGGDVILWTGGYQQPPHVAASWVLPDDRKIDPPLISTWAANDTLLFAEPDSWSGGLPQHVSLRRLTATDNGSSQVDALLTWHPNGNETGITLQEVRRSPDGNQVAFRLRHYTGSNPARDAFDSISVSGSTDLTQSLELARGTSGDGMSWSPDGTQLVAAIKGDLSIMSFDGRDTQQIQTDSGTVSYPIWVSTNEIWYEVDSQGKQKQIDHLAR